MDLNSIDLLFKSFLITRSPRCLQGLNSLYGYDNYYLNYINLNMFNLTP